ncbi:heterokaryon incompatibility protein-domain-containing protein, partial [Phaeosphaeriaceae sp. PMI808]
METTQDLCLGFLDDLEYLSQSEITDTSQSDNDGDFDNDGGNGDEGCEDNSGNFNESFDENEGTSHCKTETLQDFAYEDEGKIYADGHAIRLVQLLGGTGQIQALLFKAFLHETDMDLSGLPYEALSYTWGTNEKTQQILLNGKQFMVTQNLYSALKYLRFKNKDRILWIDAICIDQDYVKERNHQVSHMASIYRDAESVIIWLGDPTDETDILISSLKRLQVRVLNTSKLNLSTAQDSRLRTLWGNDESLCEDTLTAARLGLISLLARPWFERSWILQEVCFAKTGIVTCGTKAVAAHIFALAPWLLDKEPETHCQAVLQMMPGATRSTTRTVLSGRDMRNLYSLLRRFYRSEASDPRDQVYALLNMANDAHTQGFPKVDYRKEFKDVVNSTYAYLF